MNLEPRIQEKSAFKIVGMRIKTTPMSTDIPDLWSRFAPRIFEVTRSAEPNVSYGVMGSMDDSTGTFEYIASVSVSKLGTLPDGMVEVDIPANTYAIFDATLKTTGEVFGYIYESWLRSSHYSKADSFFFERYGEGFDPINPDSGFEIHIPVTPRN